MTSIPDLTRALADSLGIGHAPVATAARALREDGLLPTGAMGRYGAAPMTAEHAATMLIGFLGAPRVCDAPSAVRTFAKLPAVAAVYQETDGVRVTRVTHAVEDIPVGPGEELGRARLTRSLHGALANIIEARALGRQVLMAPTELGLARHLSAPLAWLRMPILSPEGTYRSAEIFYASEPDVAEAWQREKLRITASADGAVLERLGEALQDDAQTAPIMQRLHVGSGLIPLIPEGDFQHA